VKFQKAAARRSIGKIGDFDLAFSPHILLLTCSDHSFEVRRFTSGALAKNNSPETHGTRHAFTDNNEEPRPSVSAHGLGVACRRPGQERRHDEGETPFANDTVGARNTEYTQTNVDQVREHARRRARGFAMERRDPT